MNLNFAPPVVVPTELFTAMPATLRQARVTEWANANKRGEAIDSFLEGPAFDVDGNLYVVDIPYGRIFRITPAGHWTLVVQYQGWPNGLKVMADGRLLVADYQNGLVVIDPASGAVSTVLGRRQSEGFKGLNDLCIARNGDIFFTDQGQTGLHDPTGRVFRWRPGKQALSGHAGTAAGTGADAGHLDCLVDNVPSPNGLVLDPREQVLFVAATRGNAVWRVPLFDDGGVAKVGLFCQLFGASGPDGMAMDDGGRLFVAHASLGHVFVYSPRGELTHAIRSCAGQMITNLCFAPGDQRTVYITDSDTGSVLRARMPD